MKIGVLPQGADYRTFRPKEFVSKNAAGVMLRRLTHIRVSAHLIQKVAIREVPSEESMRGWFDGFLGTGNLLPFAKSQSKLRAPDSINYPIPAACDHRLRWLNSFMSKEKPQPEVYRYA